MCNNWGVRNTYDNSLAKKDLDLKFRYHRDYMKENVYSSIEHGWLPNKLKNK